VVSNIIKNGWIHTASFDVLGEEALNIDISCTILWKGKKGCGREVFFPLGYLLANRMESLIVDLDKLMLNKAK